MTTFSGYALVFLGTGVGGALRHAVNRLALSSASNFPWSTVVVNVSGSVAMGLIAGWFAYRSAGVGQPAMLFLTTGVLGGYTTFSAFSLDAALLWDRGDVPGAVMYVVGTLAMSVVGLFVGLAAMRP